MLGKINAMIGWLVVFEIVIISHAYRHSFISGTSDREDMSKTLLAMSSTAESCQAMRQSGCLPLLIQLIHANDLDQPVRTRASQALANLVQAQNDEKRRRRESRVLKLLQSVREHCDVLRVDKEKGEDFKIIKKKT